MEDKNYEIALSTAWFISLTKQQRSAILDKLGVKEISDEFLPLVWRLELWLTEEDVNKKINDFIRDEYFRDYYQKSLMGLKNK